MDNIPVTQETYDQLKQELDQLKKVERPKIIDEIAEARAQGDLSENFAYHAAKDRQGEIESRINYLEDRVARAVIIKYDAQLRCVSSDSEGHPVLYLAHKNQSSDETMTDARGLFICIGCEANVVEHVGKGRIWRCGDCSNDKKQVAVAVGDGAGVAMDIIGA